MTLAAGSQLSPYKITREIHLMHRNFDDGM